MTCCVYWIRLKEHTDMTKEGYIGLSTNFKERMETHLNYSSKLNTHVYRAIRKYGWDSLVKSVIVISTKEYCKELEFKLRPKASIGWNEIPGGNSSPSKSPEVAAKISAALKGRVGKPHTEASKGLIANGNRNRVLSDESKKKISDAMRKTQADSRNNEYEITHPDGSVEITTCLTDWCISHAFKPTYLFRVCRGERHQYKGYKCRKLTTSCQHEG